MTTLRCNNCVWWEPEEWRGTKVVQGVCHAEPQAHHTIEDYYCRLWGDARNKHPEAPKWSLGERDKPRPLTKTYDGDEKLPPEDYGDIEILSSEREILPMTRPDPTHTDPPKDTQGDEMGNP